MVQKPSSQNDEKEILGFFPKEFPEAERFELNDQNHIANLPTIT